MDTWRHGDSLICDLLTCSFVDVDGHWVIQLDIYGYLNGTYRGSGMLLHSLTVLYLNFASKLYAQTRSFNALLKDKEIIAAEVLNEYNHGVRFLALCIPHVFTFTALQFVYPRINPIRKDVAVMTHQSEIVNVWED